MSVGEPGGFVPEVRITATSRWQGLADGHGHLTARRLELVAEGRRMPRPRRHQVWCPDPEGRVAAVAAVSPVVSSEQGPAAFERAG